MTNEELAFAPAWQLCKMIASREVSPVELVEVFLQRIEQINPKLNAYLTVTDVYARSEAKNAEETVSSGKPFGPLLGVPIAIKDLEQTKGIRTTMGSLVYKDFVPDEDSIEVERLRAAGVIILGKTNASEFGMLGETKNRLGDHCRNPWDTTRTTGDSSGGSAASIVSGLAPLSTGSDSAGFITCPAGFCGVYGIKPTLGRIPRRPPGGPDLFVHHGPLTRTVKDAALMLQVTAGHDRLDPMAIREGPPDYITALEEPLGELRVAWSPDQGFAAVDKDVLSVSRKAAFAFESLGCNVEKVKLDYGNPFEFYNPINDADSYVGLGNLLEQHADKLHPESVTELIRARAVTAEQYSKALTRLWHFRSQMADLFEDYDLLITPTNPVTAFPVDEQPSEIGGVPVEPHWTTFMPLQVFWNLTGYPVASVPCGFGEDGLPVGMMIAAKWGREDLVLKASAAFEEVHPWADKRPPVS